VEPLLENLSKLTLDFEKVDYVSSAGLRVLLTFEQKMEENKKPMELCHVNDMIRDGFEVTGFLDILTIV
jgi:anti-sigma B factor antagonist